MSVANVENDQSPALECLRTVERADSTGAVRSSVLYGTAAAIERNKSPLELAARSHKVQFSFELSPKLHRIRKVYLVAEHSNRYCPIFPPTHASETGFSSGILEAV